MNTSSPGFFMLGFHREIYQLETHQMILKAIAIFCRSLLPEGPLWMVCLGKLWKSSEMVITKLSAVRRQTLLQKQQTVHDAALICVSRNDTSALTPWVQQDLELGRVNRFVPGASKNGTTGWPKGHWPARVWRGLFKIFGLGQIHTGCHHANLRRVQCGLGLRKKFWTFTGLPLARMTGSSFCHEVQRREAFRNFSLLSSVGCEAARRKGWLDWAYPVLVVPPFHGLTHCSQSQGFRSFCPRPGGSTSHKRRHLCPGATGNHCVCEPFINSYTCAMHRLLSVGVASKTDTAGCICDYYRVEK